jgi:hypothetical protein
MIPEISAGPIQSRSSMSTYAQSVCTI